MLDDAPCLGCGAKRPEPGIAEQIGDYLLYQITPLKPQPRDYDPLPGPVDLSPDQVSKTKPELP